MARNIKLLLTENVESLGIVGDVVNVRIGYARNFLLPRDMATTPSEEAVKAVAAKRADAEKQLAELRKDREALIKKLEKVEITIQRSCNDLGHLYGSVTQQEIAGALKTAGYPGIRPRDVRLNQNIKRIDNYDIHIKFEADLESTIKLHVTPDRKLDTEKREEMDFDNFGRLIEKKPGEAKTEDKKEGEAGEGKDAKSADGKAADGKSGAKPDGKDRPRRDDRGGGGGGEGGDRPRRDRDDKPRRGRGGGGLAEAMAAMEASAGKKTGWGAKKDAPAEAKPEGKHEGKPEAKGEGKEGKKDKPGKDKKSKKD